MILWAITIGSVPDRRYRKRHVAARGAKCRDPRCLIQDIFSMITFVMGLSALLGRSLGLKTNL